MLWTDESTWFCGKQISAALLQPKTGEHLIDLIVGLYDGLKHITKTHITTNLQKYIILFIQICGDVCLCCAL